VEAENAAALASASEDAEGFVRKIALLEGELVAERPAQEVFERERREQFEELTLLQTRGSDLCHAIIDPPQARHHLSEGMRHAALRHTEMAWSRRTHILSGLPRGSVTCSLGHHPVGPDWAIVWMSLPDSLGRRW
jgi:hypothetical protein